MIKYFLGIGVLALFVACVQIADPDRVGMLDIPQTYQVDVDRGKLGPKTGFDLWYHALTDSEKYLEPKNGAKVAVVGRIWGRLFGCTKSKLTSKAIDFKKIKKGKSICIETNLDNQARLHVLGFTGTTLNTRYELWGEALPPISRVVLK